MKKVYRLVAAFLFAVLVTVWIGGSMPAFAATVKKFKVNGKYWGEVVPACLLAQADYETGVILSSWKEYDPSTGMTAYELLRESISQDLHATMSAWWEAINDAKAWAAASSWSSRSLSSFQAKLSSKLSNLQSFDYSPLGSVTLKDVYGSDTVADYQTVGTGAAELFMPQWGPILYDRGVLTERGAALSDCEAEHRTGPNSTSTIDWYFLSFYVLSDTGSRVPIIFQMSEDDTGNSKTKLCTQFNTYFRRALLECLTEYSFEIYDYEIDEGDLVHLSDINTSAYRLKYIVNPLMGVVPISTNGVEIMSLDDLWNRYMDLSGSDGYGAVDGGYPANYKPYKTWRGVGPGRWYTFVMARFKKTYSERASSIPSAAQHPWNNIATLAQCITLKYDDTPVMWGKLYGDEYYSAPYKLIYEAYNCSVYTSCNSYMAGCLQIHPDYLSFICSLYADDYSAPGFVDISSEVKHFYTGFLPLGEKELETSICLLDTLVPLSYIKEWNPTSSAGIYTYAFGTEKTSFPMSSDNQISTYFPEGTSTLGQFYYNTTTGVRHSCYELSDEDQEKVFQPTEYHLEYITGRVTDKGTGALSYTAGADSGEAVTCYIDLRSGEVYVPTYTLTAAVRTDISVNAVVANDAVTAMPGLQSGRLLKKMVKTDITISDCYLLYTTVVPSVGQLAHDTLWYSENSIARGVTAANYLYELQYYDYTRKSQGHANILWDSDFSIQGRQLWGLTAIPTSYMECISVTEKETSTVDGKKVTIDVLHYVPDGRNLTFSLDAARSFDMLDAAGAVHYSNAGDTIAGVYYNVNGTLTISSDPEVIEYEVWMLPSGPSIALNSDFYESSGVLKWLSSNEASTYMSARAVQTGYTSSSLYSHLISKGVNISLSAEDLDEDRLSEIQSELEGRKDSSILSMVLMVISLCGIILMIYATMLLIAFYIDIFNTLVNFSVLSMLTFGRLRAVQTRDDLDAMGITDNKERKRYVTRWTILIRWALTMGLGLLLFSASQVYVWAYQLFFWIADLFGI